MYIPVLNFLPPFAKVEIIILFLLYKIPMMKIGIEVI